MNFVSFLIGVVTAIAVQFIGATILAIIEINNKKKHFEAMTNMLKDVKVEVVDNTKKETSEKKTTKKTTAKKTTKTKKGE